MKYHLKSLVARLNHLGLPLPQTFRHRAERFYGFLKARDMAERLFESATLEYNNHGYWFVEPMPTLDDLNLFYSTTYWAARTDSQVLLKSRDVGQINQLLISHGDKLLVQGPKTAVNFGSGHGGASFLFRAQGFRVINVDPYPGEVNFFEYRNSLEDVKETVDVFYASHSLEHVIDIRSTIGHIQRLLKPGGLLFIEVPNANFEQYLTQSQGSGRKPRLQIPHTYYFTRQFFETLPFDERSIETFLYDGNPWGRRMQEDAGEVIRFCGIGRGFVDERYI